MRWLAAVLTLSAVSCTPFDLTIQRPYPCTRDGGADQCPESARCGLDDFCHPVGVAAAYPCQGNDDCEGGWHCGAGNVCYDLTTAKAVACRDGLDAGESDCAPGWHCGVDHVCYELATAGAVPCRQDLSGADCAPGWRCGLESACHDRDAGAPYLCATDPDCERGWRCGQDGRCLDTANDALVAPTALDSLQLARISPAYDQTPSLFSVNDTTQLPFNPAPKVEFAAVDPLGLWTEHLVPDPSTGRDNHLARRTPLSRSPLSLAIVAGRPFVLDSAGLSELVFDADAGTTTLQAVPFPLDAGQLRSTESNSVTGTDLLAFAGSQLAMMRIAVDGGVGPYTLLDGSGQPLDILDVAEMQVDGTYSQQDWLLSTPRGLYLVHRTDDAFLDEAYAPVPVPVPIPLDVAGFPNADCDGGLPMVPARRLHSMGPYNDSVAMDVSPDPSHPRVTAVVRPFGRPILRCSETVFDSHPPADACPEGGQMAEFFINFSDLVSRCRVPIDGGVEMRGYWQVYNPDDGGYRFETDQFVAGNWTQQPRLPEIAAQTSAVTLGLVNEQGRMVACNTSYCAPLTLSAPPTLVLGTLDAGALATPTTDSRTQPSRYAHGVGFINSSVGAGPSTNCARVVGAPELTVTCAQHSVSVANTLQVVRWDDGFWPPLASLIDSTQVPTPPFSTQVGDVYPAELAITPDGGHELVVAAFDRVWAGELGDRLSVDAGVLGAEGPAELEVKMTPLPGSRIGALTVGGAAPDAGSALLSGYLLTAQRLFSFVAENQARWRSTEVLLPDGEPLAVWVTGGRARVGYRSGAVYSLPSRVQIGEELAPSQGPASGFAAHCSAGYALGSGGLFQLADNPDGGVRGVWRPVPVPGLDGAGADHGWANARLLATDDELLLITGHGTTVRIHDPACGP